MKDPWIGRTVALLLGGICGSYLPGQSRVLVFGILVLFGVRLILWRPRDFFGRVFRPEILLCGASLLLGFGYGALAERTLPEPLILDRVEIVGMIKDWTINEDMAVGILRVEEGELIGQTYRLTVYPNKTGDIPGEWERIRPGDHVNFRANIERPKPLGTPGGVDRRLYYGVRGLSGTLSAQGDVVVLAIGEPSLSWTIRQQVRNRLQAFDSEEVGVLEGILFGDSSRIPDEVQERYKVTGVLHVFAASGSNVAFVLGLSWLLLGFVPKGIRISGTILVLLLYATLCGGNAPIVRATIMGIAFLLGRLGRGKVATLRWLLFAGVGLFIHNPLIIQDVGFQLSFLATWGIVVLTPRILKLEFLVKVPKFIRFAIAGTLAAQVATLPVLMTAFHRLSLIGLLTNIFILFAIGSVLEVGLIGVLLSFTGELSAPFFQVSLWLLDGVNRFLKVLADLPYADVWVLNPGFLFGLFWYGGIGTFLWGKQKTLFWLKGKSLFLKRGFKTIVSKIFVRFPLEIPQAVQQRFVLQTIPPLSRDRVFVQIVALLLMVLFLWSPWNFQNDLEIVMIDVGQGDAILIRTPRKQAILIDAGPRNDRFDAGERIVLPYLLLNRIRHLNALLITHEHQDHIGGVRTVLANVPTDWVGVPDVGERLDNEEWKEGLPEKSANQDLGLRMLQAGDRIDLDSGAWLDVLGPNQILEGTHSDANNNSLVLKLNYLGKSVMLTGDMEQEEMVNLVKTGENLETDIFKEPHHGSRFSLYRPWLDSIRPYAVWISVGKNSFGHPSQEVLQYWGDRQVPVFRTDEHGTLRLLIGERGILFIPGH